jgi:hypothetical protein
MTAGIYFEWYIHLYFRNMITERQAVIVGGEARPQRM